MNIFYLDNNPKICAKYHNDKHCVKMILEYAQLLSTAHRELDLFVNESLYKSAFKNHPSAKWVRENVNNYLWLYKLWTNLCDEYTHRYGKKHLTDIKLRELLKKTPHNIPNTEFTQPPMAMPDDVKHTDSIIAYRKYYKIYKKHLAKWTKREIPIFYNE